MEKKYVRTTSYKYWVLCDIVMPVGRIVYSSVSQPGGRDPLGGL